MNEQEISGILEEVPFLKFRHINGFGLLDGAWFSFEAKPLSSPIDLEEIVSDLNSGFEVHIDTNGSIRHKNDCKATTHSINQLLKSTIGLMRDATFKVAIWEGRYEILNGQPVVFALDPEISYIKYPDHPHINAGFRIGDSYIPESICYIENPALLGNDRKGRMLEAILQTCMWLLRHQIWLSSKEINKNRGIWIGPETAPNSNTQFLFQRNPIGSCYCGSGRQYYECHLIENFNDLSVYDPNFALNENRCTYRNQDGSINKSNYVGWWIKNKLIPNQITLSALKSVLLS